MPKKPFEPLCIGIGGYAVAIDPETGEERWRTMLRGAGLVTIICQRGRVYAGNNGELFCLDAASGEIVWNNPLKRLGTGLVTFSGGADGVAESAAAAAAVAAAAAAEAAT